MFLNECICNIYYWFVEIEVHFLGGANADDWNLLLET
jgi:hypothetical protein